MARIASRILWIEAPHCLDTPYYLALDRAPVRYPRGFLRAGGVAVLALIVVGDLLLTTH
ncbi:hypothetical protein ABZT06_47015 [Streptomyces sp. NPDC005483]|uniref:hypothetical protein n=1 Tax=Streptomyces sp. NPDC005483 TaxID=3154882 RepID=UPI0033AD60A1